MLTWSSGYAQTFTNYTVTNVSENIAGMYCSCTAVDHNDNLWVGTHEGLSKFDGKNWTIYTTEDGLIGTGVTDIAFEGENIYVATSFGISIFNGETWTGYNAEDGLPNYYIAAVAVDHDKNVWIGSYHGIAKFDGTEWTVYDENSGFPYTSVKDIRFDNDGIGWFVSGQDGLIKYENGAWTEYTIDNGKSIQNPHCIDVDLSNNKWVGTSNGAYKINKSSSTLYTESDGVAGKSIFGIHSDHNGHIWFGTENGASKFDGTLFTNYEKNNGLLSNQVLKATSDSKGNVFLGTDKGVSKFDGNNWSAIRSEKMLSNLITSISGTANGDIWIGTSEEVIQVTDTGWVQRTNNNGAIALTAAKNGDVWVSHGVYGFGNGDALSCYSGNTRKIYNSENTSLPNDFIIYNMTEDQEGNMWFCSDKYYIVKFDGINWETIDLNVVPRVMISDSKNNLWIGTLQNGIAKYDGQSWTSLSESDGLCDKHVRSLAVDSNGNLWIGTANGLSKYDGTNFTTYSTEDGLISNSIVHLAVDSNNDIWVSHTEGLSVFKDNSFTHYSTENGLLDNSSRALYADNNSIWFGTNKGISVISMESPFLNISKEALNFGAEKSSIDSFTVTSNTSWHITTNSPWIKCHKTHGIDNYEIKVTCNENVSGAVRLGEIYISANGIPSKTIKVEQGNEVTDINETERNNEFVYLDRITQEINIHYSDINRVQVYDMYGRLLKVSTANKININAYRNGTYIVLVSKNDNTRYSHKLVK